MRLALVSVDPWEATSGYRPFNFGVRRVQAELLSRAIPDLEVHLIDVPGRDTDRALEAIERLDPDVIGCAAYVWSFPFQMELAREAKRRRPDVTVIFGGPSAHPSMFELEPWRSRRSDVDALVRGEGELALAQLLSLPDRTLDAFATVPSVSVRSADGFRDGHGRASLARLDELASPYRLGLVPEDVTAHLETFRGCPFHCAFCQGGKVRDGSRAFSRAYLAEELRAIRARTNRPPMLIDPGLNLNPHAFRNLVAAEEETGVLAELGLSFELYPSHLGEEHLRFLDRFQPSSVGVGLQSYDEDVLRNVDRRFDAARFESIVRKLAARGVEVRVEIIMGLPGDGPETFFRTLERARELPCQVRVFHCLVLPDALMDRMGSDPDLRFDPRTLRLVAGGGWSESALRETVERLGTADGLMGVSSGVWLFEGTGAPRREEESPPAATTPDVEASEGPSEQVLDRASIARVSGAFERATAGLVSVTAVERRPGCVLLTLRIADAGVVLELSHTDGMPAFAIVEGVAVRHRGHPPERALSILTKVVPRLSRLLQRLTAAA